MPNLHEVVECLLPMYLEKETQLLVNNSSEQAISHRLAVMLEKEFSEWNVDCEYNRDESTIKRLKYAISPNEPVEERNVVPDIIVHKRMTQSNLLVIEVKKSTNPEPDEKDIAKLNAFKVQLGYQEALFVRFLAGTQEPEIQCIKWV